jgi:signal transduction histidine kinase
VRCREEVERLARLATDLLVLARSDAALPLEHVAVVELKTLVGRVLERFQPVADARKLRLEVVAEDAIVEGTSDCSTASLPIYWTTP